MCGIVGSVNGRFKDNFLSVIDHRGPDDTGMIKHKNVILAHHRLSILDTSTLGHQPMFTKEGNLTIIFNGEIYNHLDLRQTLSKQGYTFNSGSDTETLLKGWDYWGKDILEKLNGIFAFAILNKEKNTLFLVRDNFGVKPLYFYENGNSFAFASELKIFNYLEHFKDTLSPEALKQYLSFLWAPGKETPYQFVHKLLPGHYLEIPLENPSEQTEHQYSELSFRGEYLSGKSEHEIINHLDKLLKQAVKRQLLSDVPLGFFLSGGLDSSLLVSMANHLYPEKHFDCFTIASNMDEEGKGFEDDLPYAKLVANHLNLDLHIIEANADIVNQFDYMVWHLDEPQADPSPMNVYNISKGARELGIKVLLGGTAGDDLFSGYQRHKALFFDRYLEYIPTAVRKIAKIGINKLPTNGSTIRKLQKLSRDWNKPINKRMLGYFNWLPDDEYVNSLFQKNMVSNESSKSVYAYFNQLLNQQNSGLSQLDKLLYLELKTFLVDHNLNYTDKMSMATGVETRVPYLDKDVVEFAGQIPTRYKLGNGETKYILKKVAESYLPNEVIYRSKTGFGAPVRKWLKNELKPMVNERLNREHLRKQGIFNPSAIENMIECNDSGEFDFSYSIWGMLAIQSWLKQFNWSL